MTDKDDNTELETTLKSGITSSSEPSENSGLADTTAVSSDSHTPAVLASSGPEAPEDPSSAPSDAADTQDAIPQEDPELKKRTRRALWKYAGVRLALFIVLTVIIQLFAVLIEAPVPLVMSAMLALIIAFPLSMLIFTKLREEATYGVAQLSKQRKERKKWIKEELSKR